LAIAAVIVLLFAFSGFTFWALRERAKAVEQTQVASKEKENAKLQELIANQKTQEAIIQESLAKQEKIKSDQLRNKAEEAMLLAEIKKNEAINANSIAEQEKQNALKAKEKAENDLYMNVINTLTVSADRVNVVYRGIENPITVAASGIKNENLIIKVISNDETRVSGDSGRYKLFPGSDPICEIEVQAKVLNNETIVLGKKSFRVKNIPRPIALFCNKSEGLISPHTVLIDSLTVNIPDFDFDLNFQIDSYTFIMKTEFHTQELNIKGSKLTKPIIDYLQTLKSGDEIIFNNIKAIGPDGRRFPLNPIFLKIS